MVIMEAFEFGLPVIAYHMGAMDLIIDDGKTGFLPEAFDPHKFAQAMLKLAHDEELRARMSANAIAKSDDFSIDKAVKVTLCIDKILTIEEILTITSIT